MVKEKEAESRSVGRLLANATYTNWLLEAIRKIKNQKQRPSVERIVNAVRQQHNLGWDSIAEQLDLAVKDGTVLKVHNKGLLSYKDPTRLTALKTRILKVDKKTDLTKTIVRSIKEIGQAEGSNAKTIEKHIRRGYAVELIDDADLTHQVRISIKRAVNSRHIIQDGRLYKVPGSSDITISVDSDSLVSSGSTSALFDPADEVETARLLGITLNEKNKVIYCAAWQNYNLLYLLIVADHLLSQMYSSMSRFESIMHLNLYYFILPFLHHFGWLVKVVL